MKCLVCLKRPADFPEISLHKIPKNIALRKKWLEACGLEETYRLTGKVCSDHFEENCFHKNYIRRTLVYGSLPTIFSSEKPLVNGHENHDDLVNRKEKSRDSQLFCPRTMARYDNSPSLYGTQWVCRICLTFILSENAVRQHLINCNIPSDEELDEEDSLEQLEEPNKLSDNESNYVPSISSSTEEESCTSIEDDDLEI